MLSSQSVDFVFILYLFKSQINDLAVVAEATKQPKSAYSLLLY